MNKKISDSEFNDVIVDDQMDERDEYAKEYNALYEDTQDFSEIVEEINSGNRYKKRERD